MESAHCLSLRDLQVSGQLLFTGQLPGGKQHRGELVPDTVQRLLEERLAPLASCVELGETTRTLEEKERRDFAAQA
eukprot:5639640-Amphidinium_carterae.3